ncbi:hypothetical protein GOODEAATRI_001065 [Goodea atripinnis]|uniref:Uncharacterized protein n=1 Tax=Goodea atripinnis TaxID=208336 RepID=A0ABV0MNC2_9TELE
MRLGREVRTRLGLQKQVNCYLAALNCLRLIRPEYAWIVQPVSGSTVDDRWTSWNSMTWRKITSCPVLASRSLSTTRRPQLLQVRIATDEAWRLLASYLDRYPSTNGQHHRHVIHKLLSHGIPLPDWLIQSYKVRMNQILSQGGKPRSYLSPHQKLRWAYTSTTVWGCSVGQECEKRLFLFQNVLCCLDRTLCMSVSLWVMGAGGCVFKVHVLCKLFKNITAKMWSIITNNLFWYAVTCECSSKLQPPLLKVPYDLLEFLVRCCLHSDCFHLHR